MTNSVSREEPHEEAGCQLFKDVVRSRLDEWMRAHKPYLTVIGYPETYWNPWAQCGPRMKRGDC